MTDIYAWMASGPDGEYPLGAVSTPSGQRVFALPLMTTRAELARGARFRQIARIHAERTGERVRLLRYEVAEELQVIPGTEASNG